MKAGPALETDAFREVRRRAIFDCFKWDPQFGDHGTLADFPLLLEAAEWRELADRAEAIALEAEEAEAEVLGRPELLRRLGLPRGVVARLLETASRGRCAEGPRFLRVDFHATPEGWRFSETNTDVPGGFVEASGVAPLVAARCPGFRAAGDPAGALADAVAARAASGPVALVHATAYSDDHQVMAFLARSFERRGLRAVLVSPAHLRWCDGTARVETDRLSCDLGLVLRFFPAEWLPEAPRACGWPWFFRGARTPVSNPGHALVSQSKRFPLLFADLRAALPTWRARLPETRSPADVPVGEEDGWVFKPALGRVGEAVGISGVTNPEEWRQILGAARRRPGWWAAQRRFTSVAVSTALGPRHACVGVFVVDGVARGAYGRVSVRPLIDGDAQDAAVLVRDGGGNGRP